jgi:hypothetical protein
MPLSVSQNALANVAGGDFRSKLIECRPNGRELREDVAAVLALLHHATETSDLALDAGQSAVNLPLRFCIH